MVMVPKTVEIFSLSSQTPKNKRKQNLKAAADSYNRFSVLDESEWIDESDVDIEFSSYHPT